MADRAPTSREAERRARGDRALGELLRAVRHAGIEQGRHQRRQERGALLARRCPAARAPGRGSRSRPAGRRAREPPTRPPRGAAPPRREVGRAAGADLLLVADTRPPDGRRCARRLRAARPPAPPARPRGARAAAPARTSPATRTQPRGPARARSAAHRLRAGGGAHEQIAPHQAVAGLLDLGARDAVREGVHRSDLERVARDRAQRQRRALGGVKPIQTGREQRVQRGRERVGRGLLLVEVGDQLLEEERVAAGRGGDPSLAASCSRRPPAMPSSRATLAARRERAEGEHALRSTRRRPLGPALQQIRPRDADDRARARRAAARRRRRADPAAPARRGARPRRPGPAAVRAPARRSAAGRPSPCPRPVVPVLEPHGRRHLARRGGAEPQRRRELADRAPAHGLERRSRAAAST